MRVASYNIFEGAQDTYSLLKAFVIEHDIDVLCLQEANDWHTGETSRIDDFTSTTDLKYSAFGDSNTDCKLAVFSRSPIESQRLHTKQFWHCAMQLGLQINGHAIQLWNTHLNPFDEEQRLREARFIAAHARDAIIVGDMNSLSREDHYSDALARAFQQQGNVRYGNGKLRYDVTDYFTGHGFFDAAARAGRVKNTFPARTDCEDSPQTMRLDYMFVPKSLDMAIKSVHVVKNNLTARISDHYPLVTTFALPPLRQSKPKQLRPKSQRSELPLQAA